MSTVQINPRNVERHFEALSGSVQLVFVYNEAEKTIAGNYHKVGEQGNILESWGSMSVSAEGHPRVDLRKPGQTFVADFKICVDLVTAAVNHVNSLPNEG